MSFPKTFFDFNGAYIRISEIVCIRRDGRDLVVTLRRDFSIAHTDHDGSAAKLERRLLEAIAAVEG